MKFGLKREKENSTTIEEPVIVVKPLETHIVAEEVESFDPWDYVRVTNVRGEPEYQSQPDEKVIVGHRENPVLGNKHAKTVHTMEERERVIAEHKKDLEADLAIQGPIWQVLQNIAHDIVENKQKIAIECWCTPKRCHNDLVVPVIVEMAQEILKNKQQNKYTRFKI